MFGLQPPRHRPFACLPTVLVAWHDLRRRRPEVSPYEAARCLRLSEAEIVAALASGGGGVPLRCESDPILAAIGALKPVTAITRNRYAVLESSNGFVCEPRPSTWRFAFALRTSTPEGDRCSIQLFGADGAAVHAVFTKRGSDLRMFDELVALLAPSPLSWAPPVIEMIDRGARLKSRVDIERFRDAVALAQDEREFADLLESTAGTRERGLSLAGIDVARRVGPNAHRRAIAQAIEHGLQLTCTVVNRGMVHTLTMNVPRPLVTPPWYELFGKNQALHLDESGIASAWVVRIPVVTGSVDTLELFDRQGALVLQLRGSLPGQPRSHTWAELLSSL